MHDRTLVLIRGVSGSGKTTLAKAIGCYSSSACVSADEWFEDDDGNYRFDANELSKAHDWCLSYVEYSMKHNRRRIVVHNTFTQNWEMEPYFQLAKRKGYSVFVVCCENDFGSEHNIPQSAIDNQRRRFEDNRN